MTTAAFVVPVHADSEARLTNLRSLAPYLGHVLRSGTGKQICQALRQLGRCLSLGAHEAPSIKPDFEYIREIYAKLLEAIDRRDFIGARDVVSEMLDRAGLF